MAVDVDDLALFSPDANLGHGQVELSSAHRAAGVTVGDRDASPDEPLALLRQRRRRLELLLEAKDRSNAECGELLERHPSLVRGLLGSLSLRLVELTSRLTELTGGRVEARFARLFLKLADRLGEPRHGAVFIPLPLTRQELADLIGTTIETAIRVMSRWHKDDVIATEKDGFLVVDRKTLEELSQ